ncbi:hypothetical protein PN480_20030 [Dolichospermum circinale CS-1225]|uniref:Uncharacterized protein n=1 Tax=Dolichospermum circinale CS-537/01 TaxID=3021739 RepID=A0ABT5A1M6_9CYAN|nr:hypothetical protein [Dolichospermum circinale]MDB9457704.1 hypothetical protein [Dolichospermum circinale CS-545/17]MDB9485051.1 hypothetical protein [Dolichospermum circinale CS-537/01]MDB9524213.1 hypothetical protein [Dolichospermum circinale CS-1225]
MNYRKFGSFCVSPDKIKKAIALHSTYIKKRSLSTKPHPNSDRFVIVSTLLS